MRLPLPAHHGAFWHQVSQSRGQTVLRGHWPWLRGSQLEQCSWHLAGGGRCPPHTGQPSTIQNYLAQDVNRAEAEKLKDTEKQGLQLPRRPALGECVALHWPLCRAPGNGTLAPTGTAWGRVGRRVPSGLGVGEGWGNAACGPLQDAVPWGRLAWAPAGGQRLLLAWEGEQPRAQASWAQVLEPSYGGQGKAAWHPDEAALELRPGVPDRARAW